MNEEFFRKLEAACEQVYNAPNQEQRKMAELQLAGFSRVESAAELKMIFDKSKNPYALFFAASQLLKLFTNQWNAFSKSQKNEISKSLVIIVIDQLLTHMCYLKGTFSVIIWVKTDQTYQTL